MTQIKRTQMIQMALWVAQNKKVSTEDLCRMFPKLHEFEVILLLSGTVEGYVPIDPVSAGYLTTKDVLNNEKNEIEVAQIIKTTTHKHKRYIPNNLKSFIPGAIVWLNQSYPSLTPRQIAPLFGKVPKYVSEVLSKDDIAPVNPISCQLITGEMLNNLLKDKN